MWKRILAISVICVQSSVIEMVCGGKQFKNQIVCSTTRHESWCCDYKSICGDKNGTCLAVHNLRH